MPPQTVLYVGNVGTRLRSRGSGPAVSAGRAGCDVATIVLTWRRVRDRFDTARHNYRATDANGWCYLIEPLPSGYYLYQTGLLLNVYPTLAAAQAAAAAAAVEYTQ